MVSRFSSIVRVIESTTTSVRGTMICRAVRFENWKTPSMISRFSSERMPAFSELARISRSSSGECAVFVLAGRMDAEELQQRARDRRSSSQIAGIGDDVERVQQVRGPERRADRLLDGDRLRRQLAEDDVQDGDDHEGDRRGDRVRDRLGAARRSASKQRLDEVRERRLADPAEGQGGQRDAELRRGEIGVEMLDEPAAPSSRARFPAPPAR